MSTPHRLTRQRISMIYRPFMAALLLLLLILSQPPTAHALPGDLDLTFDGDGIVTTSLTGDGVIAVQTDGKIVVAAGKEIRRYNPDGTVDTTFVTDGLTAPALDGLNVVLADVAIQTSGKIVVGGHAGLNATNYMLAARYNTDGTLDTSFGDQGISLVRYVAFPDIYKTTAQAMILQTNDKILLAGYMIYQEKDIVVARLTADGQLDELFGELINPANPLLGRKGYDRLSISTPGDDYATGLAVQEDGKIIVTGYTEPESSSAHNIIVIRYNDNGTLDTSFANNGFFLYGITYSVRARAVEIQLDGKIVVASDINEKLTIIRLTTNGDLDSSFAENGIFTYPDPSSSGTYQAFDLNISSDQTIVVSLRLGNHPMSSVGIMWITPNGQRDTNFTNGGLYTYRKTNFGNKIALQSDGKVVLAIHPYNNTMEVLRVQGQSFIWDGGGATNNWSEAANWEPDMVPTVGEAVLFNTTSSKNAVIDASFDGSVESLIIDAGYTGTIQQERDLTIGQRLSQADGFFNSQNHALTVGENFTLEAGTFIASP